MAVKPPPRELTAAEEKFLSWRDLEERWRCSSNSIRRMIGRGELEPPLEFGPQLQRFRLSNIVSVEQTRKPRRGPGKWTGRRTPTQPAAD
jgi:hypothetical protein